DRAGDGSGLAAETGLQHVPCDPGGHLRALPVQLAEHDCTLQPSTVLRLRLCDRGRQGERHGERQCCQHATSPAMHRDLSHSSAVCVAAEGAFLLATGSVTLKVVDPGSECTLMLPPWRCSTVLWASGRPRPVPSPTPFVVK